MKAELIFTLSSCTSFKVNSYSTLLEIGTKTLDQVKRTLLACSIFISLLLSGDNKRAGASSCSFLSVYAVLDSCKPELYSSAFTVNSASPSGMRSEVGPLYCRFSLEYSLETSSPLSIYTSPAPMFIGGRVL